MSLNWRPASREGGGREREREGTNCPFPGLSPCGPGAKNAAVVLLGMVAHDFNPNTREIESGEALGVPGQPGLCF